MSAQSIAKAKLTPKDYNKWSTLIQENLSPNGKWVSYILEYDSGKDTLFAKNTITLKQYYFPEANNADFSNDGHWLTANQDNNVLLQNLITGELKSIDFGIKANFFLEDKYLVVLLKKVETKDLLILDLTNNTDYKIENVKEYVISQDKKSVAYITQNNSVKLFWVDKKLNDKFILKGTKNIRKNLIWNNKGDALTFLEEFSKNDSSETNHKIYFLKKVREKVETYHLNPSEPQGLIKGKTVFYNPSFTPLLISPDNKRVFFYLKGVQRNSAANNTVEVWKSSDRVEFQRNVLEGNPKSRPKLVVWWPESEKLFEITNDQHPSVYLTPDRNKAIVFDLHQYEPQKEIIGPSDLYLIDLNSGNKTLILNKQSGKVGRLGVSPNSRYLNYYKNGNWWIYDIDTEKHTLITNSLTDKEKVHYPGTEPLYYEFVGWADDSRNLIFQTLFDVWLVSVDGKKQEKITNGKSEEIRYRVSSNLIERDYLFKSYDIIGITFNLGCGLILEAFDITNKASGYYKWTRGSNLQKIVFKNAKLSRIKKASQKNAYIMVEQKSNVSPRIMFINSSVKEKTLVKTNTHQYNFDWTKSELISYENSDKEKIQGVLYYPSDYKPGRKYPMIVYIYEHQSQLLNQYYNPTLYNQEGFSPNNYTTDGYFVLYPDIVYKEGKPGYSAVDCVEAAITKILDKKIVDKNRIGLIGHSFGGYETAFIITQTNRFAAAVAGAAISDFVFNSLSLDSAGRAEMWRYQTHQMRMGKSLYEDYKGFIENSPISYAQNITTPLLSWAGRNDPQVDPHQSIALHMAMRSLKKNSTLLLYPGEPHVLLNPEFQKDLTLKVKDWFNFYLKDIPFPKNTISE